MKKTLLVAAGLAISASAARAQTTCAAGIPTTSDQATANARQQASDLYQFVAPQLAEALVGGSATLGQASTLGGLGHFSFGVRATAVAGAVPDITKLKTCYTGAVHDTIFTKTAPVPMPAADAIIGIFPGLPLGLTNVGGVDLLISAAYIPAVDQGDVSVKVPNGSLQLGYGARVGILSEGILVPGVSVSYLKRDLPKVSLNANHTTGASTDSLFVNGLSVKSTAWRVMASKSLILFGVAAGFGQDKLESSVDTIRANVGAPAPLGRVSGQLVPLPQSVTRTNYFVDASLNLIVLKITGEVGQSTGGTINTFNFVSGSHPDGARTYASLGVRIGL